MALLLLFHHFFDAKPVISDFLLLLIYTKISFWNFPTFKDPVQYAKKLEKQTADRLANGVWDPMKPTDIVLDVYKHVEFQHLEISIEPKTFRIFEGRKDLEAWFQRDNLDIKQLIEDGILFKVKHIILYCEFITFWFLFE